MNVFGKQKNFCLLGYDTNNTRLRLLYITLANKLWSNEKFEFVAIFAIVLCQSNMKTHFFF